MAFQDVRVGNVKKVTDLAIGESLTGYVVRFEKSAKQSEGKGAGGASVLSMNIVMQDEKGEQILLFTAGNIKYLINDGKIKEGLLTMITRLPDTKRGGMKATDFKVQQDAEQTLADAAFAALGDTAPAAPANVSAIQQAVEKSAIKAQSDRLANSMKRN